MQNKMRYTEENIEKLLQASYCKEERLDDQLKEDTLLLLEQKLAQNSKVSQPENKIVVALSLVWVVIIVLIFSELKLSIYMLDLIKPVLGLSLVFIPVSSVILIILKWRVYEKRMV
jgi:hypothetical protein